MDHLIHLDLLDQFSDYKNSDSRRLYSNFATGYLVHRTKTADMPVITNESLQAYRLAFFKESDNIRTCLFFSPDDRHFIQILIA